MAPMYFYPSLCGTLIICIYVNPTVRDAPVLVTADSKLFPAASSLNLLWAPRARLFSYYSSFIACALWCKLLTPWLLRTLKPFPIVDLILVGNLLYFLSVEGHLWTNPDWFCWYMVAFIPSQWLLVISIMHQLGSPFLIGRILGSRYIFRISRGSSLFVYLLHVPLQQVVLRMGFLKPRGQIGSMCLIWIVAHHASTIHRRATVAYNAGLDRLRSKMITAHPCCYAV
eukprot:Blabericola_migrator_1__11301@NODE_666_length_6969_cov_110_382932_g486_i0_p3_GENE_NODE_666_length_6969_cov_110_382932_g486_i0NODE_666_length_6969_cov_110_382932_g486_i0_p3_ORF_typecomplete_len227_score0_16PqiA/PF04403_13/0_24PqiA/PF04403_13/7_2e02_NODE_666_length_6969_cov_110_382932_g486_i036854365